MVSEATWSTSVSYTLDVEEHFFFLSLETYRGLNKKNFNRKLTFEFLDSMQKTRMSIYI